jgi:hypothetical protein
MTMASTYVLLTVVDQDCCVDRTDINFIRYIISIRNVTDWLLPLPTLAGEAITMDNGDR